MSCPKILWTVFRVGVAQACATLVSIIHLISPAFFAFFDQPPVSRFLIPTREVSMNEQAYKSIITKCWGDSDFKSQLIAEPVATLRAEGVAVPDGIKVNVVENTPTEFTFVIPPESSELSDEELAGVAGGYNRIIPPPSGKLPPSWGDNKIILTTMT